MRYTLVISTFYICSTVLLFADTGKLKDILQKSGEKKVITTPPQKQKKIKSSRFIFKDTYADRGIETIDKGTRKKKSKQYKYKNKSNFKFKFSPGYGSNNMASGAGTGTARVEGVGYGSGPRGGGGSGRR